MTKRIVQTRWLMRAAKRRFLHSAANCLILLATAASAQQLKPGPAVPLTMDTVSTARFVAVHGRRALLDGYSATGLEAWVYPFQIFRGYQPSFRISGATSSIPGQSILSRIVYQPDSVTRIYLGPGFSVREKLFVPLDKPGAIVTYSVQGSTPIQIEVRATPILDLMWPAALGGQSSAWNPALNAFVLFEPAYGYTAVVGSPQIVAHDDSGNSTMQGAEPGLAFTLQPDPFGVASVYVALNPPHASDHAALIGSLIRDREALESEAAAHWSRFAASVLQIKTPDDEVNRAIAWSEIALDQAWVCNPDLGCGYVAGYGPSRGGRRPQYDWFFAGDGLVGADASSSAGNLAQARDELEFIFRYQDAKTGMVWHELSQSAHFIDWVGKYPYMFVHVDISFQFLPTLAHYIQQSGDVAFARDHWPAIEAAYRYCSSLIDPATALPRIPADKEGGDEQDRQSDDLGLSTSWVAASAAFAQLAALTGHAGLADQASRASQSARASIPARYWDDSTSFWISGHTVQGQSVLDRRAGPEQALTLHLFSSQQSSLLLDALASSSFQTDWGTRSIGAGSTAFDPASYAKGSVWPVGTAAQADAFWSEHRPFAAFSIWRSLVPLVSLDSLGHIPEVLDGSVYRAQAESVPEQTWSSAGFLDATIHGLLGLDSDSVAGRLVFAPRLPPEWSGLSLANVKLRASSISLTLQRAPNAIALHVDNPGEPFQLDFAPDLPLGAKLGGASLNNLPTPATLENHPQQTIANLTLTVPHGTSDLRLTFSGGVSVIPPVPSPQLGDSSSAIHLVTVSFDRNLLTIDADVPSSQSSTLQLDTALKIRNAAGATAESIAPNQVELTFSAVPNASAPYRRAHVALEFEP